MSVRQRTGRDITLDNKLGYTTGAAHYVIYLKVLNMKSEYFQFDVHRTKKEVVHIYMYIHPVSGIIIFLLFFYILRRMG